jgi:Glycosyltransferase family 87
MKVKRYGFWILLGLCLCVYALFFYHYFTKPYAIDFTSFYASRLALAAGFDPYTKILPEHMLLFTTIATNLNPPFFLWLVSPFTYLSYKLSFLIWSMLSFILGIWGVRLIIKLVGPKILPKQQAFYYLIYCSIFPVFINTARGQVGALLLFLIIAGYYFFQHKRCYLAGFLWGTAVAIKFFPGLLILHALVQRRYRVTASILLTAAVFSIIPVIFYGIDIYLQYFTMLSKVDWYGDGWSCSLYGYIFRLFMDAQGTLSHPMLMRAIWVVLSMVLIFWYIKKLRNYYPDLRLSRANKISSRANTPSSRVNKTSSRANKTSSRVNKTWSRPQDTSSRALCAGSMDPADKPRDDVSLWRDDVSLWRDKVSLWRDEVSWWRDEVSWWRDNLSWRRDKVLGRRDHDSRMGKVVTKLLDDDCIQRHQAINLTIVLMLLLSPMCWVYYFPLLILPLLTTWLQLLSMPKVPIVNTLAWLTAFFLLNFPLFISARPQDMSSILVKFAFPYLYGLFLLLYLLVSAGTPKAGIVRYAQQQQFDWIVWFLVAFPLSLILQRVIRNALALMVV